MHMGIPYIQTAQVQQLRKLKVDILNSCWLIEQRYFIKDRPDKPQPFSVLTFHT